MAIWSRLCFGAKIWIHLDASRTIVWITHGIVGLPYTRRARVCVRGCEGVGGRGYAGDIVRAREGLAWVVSVGRGYSSLNISARWLAAGVCRRNSASSCVRHGLVMTNACSSGAGTSRRQLPGNSAINLRLSSKFGISSWATGSRQDSPLFKEDPSQQPTRKELNISPHMPQLHHPFISSQFLLVFHRPSTIPE